MSTRGLTWRRTAFGWTATDDRGVRWSVRGPIFARQVWWVYRDGVRFDHGTPDEPTPHKSATAAQAACEARSAREGTRHGKE
jgi:hypothetical protein